MSNDGATISVDLRSRRFGIDRIGTSLPGKRSFKLTVLRGNELVETRLELAAAPFAAPGPAPAPKTTTTLDSLRPTATGTPPRRIDPRRGPADRRQVPDAALPPAAPLAWQAGRRDGPR